MTIMLADRRSTCHRPSVLTRPLTSGKTVADICISCAEKISLMNDVKPAHAGETGSPDRAAITAIVGRYTIEFRLEVLS
jgi:hypothetical protein